MRKKEISEFFGSLSLAQRDNEILEYLKKRRVPESFYHKIKMVNRNQIKEKFIVGNLESERYIVFGLENWFGEIVGVEFRGLSIKEYLKIVSEEMRCNFGTFNLKEELEIVEEKKESCVFVESVFDYLSLRKVLTKKKAIFPLLTSVVASTFKNFVYFFVGDGIFWLDKDVEESIEKKKSIFKFIGDAAKDSKYFKLVNWNSHFDLKKCYEEKKTKDINEIEMCFGEKKLKTLCKMVLGDAE